MDIEDGNKTKYEWQPLDAPLVGRNWYQALKLHLLQETELHNWNENSDMEIDDVNKKMIGYPFVLL